MLVRVLPVVPEGNVYSLSVYSGYFVEKGEEETRKGSPLRNRCFHTQGAPLPWVLICNLPPKMDNISVIPRDLSRSNPGENGSFFLRDGLGKVTARNQQICGQGGRIEEPLNHVVPLLSGLMDLLFLSGDG